MRSVLKHTGLMFLSLVVTWFSLVLQTQAAAPLTFQKSNYLRLLKEGDLIFHQSMSSQSAAITEATGSTWTHVGVLVKEQNQWLVVEAIAKVSVTPLQKFIDRGRNKDFRVLRVQTTIRNEPHDLSPVQIAALKKRLQTFLGIPYDIYFEWSEEAIYCSELSFKAFQRELGIEVGQVQKWGDMKLDGPEVQRLLKERFEQTGKEMDLTQDVVTPVAQMNSSHLKLIYSTIGQ